MSPLSGFTGREAGDILSGVTSSKYDQRGELANAATSYRSARDRAQEYAKSQVDTARSQANSSITNSLIGAAADIGSAGFGAFSAARKTGSGISYDPTGYQKASSVWNPNSLTLPPWMSK